MSFRPSLRLSCLRFIRNRRDLDTSNFMQIRPWTQVGHWESKPEVKRSKITWKENVKTVYITHIFVKSGSIYVELRPKWSPANSTYRPIFSNKFYQLKRVIFAIFVRLSHTFLSLTTETPQNVHILLRDYSLHVLICEVSLRSKGGQGHRNENVNIVSRSYVRGKWIYFHQTNTRIIFGSSTE